VNQRLRMKSVVERYYQQKFVLDAGGKPLEDQYVNQHSNGLYMVGIAPTHPIVTKGINITSLDFNVGYDLLERVSGKYKRGAPHLQQSTSLCTVCMEDDSEYTLYICVSGNLLEVNERLVSNPELLVSKAGTEGFLAILMSNKHSNEAHLINF